MIHLAEAYIFDGRRKNNSFFRLVNAPCSVFSCLRKCTFLGRFIKMFVFRFKSFLLVFKLNKSFNWSSKRVTIFVFKFGSNWFICGHIVFFFYKIAKSCGLSKLEKRIECSAFLRAICCLFGAIFECLLLLRRFKSPL